MEKNGVEKIIESELRGWGYEAIGWLLDEVKLAGGKIPEKYYFKENLPDQLANVRQARQDFGYHGLSFAFTWERLHLEMTSVATENRRHKRLESLQKQIRLLLSTLKGDDILMSRLSIRIPVDQDTGVDLFEIINGIEKLKNAVVNEKKSIVLNSEPLLKRQEYGSKDTFLLKRLAKTYEEHFDLNPRDGLIKTYNNPKGPFVTFIDCAFVLAGRSRKSRTALYKALDRAGFMQQEDNERNL